MKIMAFSISALVLSIVSIQVEHMYIMDTWELIWFTPVQLFERFIYACSVLWLIMQVVFD